MNQSTAASLSFTEAEEPCLTFPCEDDCSQASPTEEPCIGSEPIRFPTLDTMPEPVSETTARENKISALAYFMARSAEMLVMCIVDLLAASSALNSRKNVFHVPDDGDNDAVYEQLFAILEVIGVSKPSYFSIAEAARKWSPIVEISPFDHIMRLGRRCEELLRDMIATAKEEQEHISKLMDMGEGKDEMTNMARLVEQNDLQASLERLLEGLRNRY